MNEEPANSKSWWKWLWSWGSSEPKTEVESVDENGDVQETETILPAVGPQTGDNGILRLPLPETQSDKTQNVLIAKKGHDIAFLPENLRLLLE
ncbi:MAG: hypothetical protein IPN69_08740 [Acidobacteria bacterium]|nr:hypothetical protein [Acidobacteriota bacterium]